MNKKRSERPGRPSSVEPKRRPEPQPHRAPRTGKEPRHVVASGEKSVGTITHDDLGQARWTWATELGSGTARDIDDTFDLLKALDNDDLQLADEAGANVSEPAEKPDGGYNPYDTAQIRNTGRFRKV